MIHSENLWPLREQMILVAKSMNSSGINQGKSGNLSYRIPNGMLITPSSIPYEEMEPSDLVTIDLSGKPLLAQNNPKQNKPLNPSSEWRLHADILKSRLEVNAVVHCHSIHATALACHGKGIPSFHYMTAIAGGNDIQCAEYATFGTKELSNNAMKALEGRFACLLAQHGQVAIAKTPKKALDLAIEIETLAHIYIKASQLGEPKHINSEEMKTVLCKFKAMAYGN